MKKYMILFIVLSSTTILFSQIVVNMKMPVQSTESLQVAALFEDNLQPDYPVVLGIIGFDIAGGTEPYTYFWLKDNVTIGNGPTIVIMPIVGSTYSLSVTDKNNCIISHSLNVSAIKKVNKSNYNQLKVKIYPTEVYNHINIELSEYIPQNTLVKIYDFKGIIHFQEVLYNSTTIFPTLTTGKYLVVIEGPGKYFVEKIVVTKN